MVTLCEYLAKDKEIIELKKQYEIKYKHFAPPFYVNKFHSFQEYKDYLKELINQ